MQPRALGTSSPIRRTAKPAARQPNGCRVPIRASRPPSRPHEETVEATVAWYREREGGRLARIGTRQPFGWRAAGFAVRRIGELVP